MPGCRALALAFVIPLAVPGTTAAQDRPEASPPDSTLATWLRAQGVSPDSARVIGRAAMTPHLDAVLVAVGPAYLPDEHLLIAVPTDEVVAADTTAPTDTIEPRVERDAPTDQAVPWPIAHIPERWDGVALDVVGPTSVIVRIMGSYGQEIYRQYFLDLGSRTVTEMWEYRAPEPNALLVTADTLYAVYLFRDLDRRYVLQKPLDSSHASVMWMYGDEPVHKLIVRSDTLYALTESSELWRRGGVWVGRGRSRPLQPSEGVRLLHPRLPQFRIAPGGIVETRLGDSLFIPPDLPDFDDFVRARPEHHEQVRNDVEIATEIEPTTAHEGRVWFGLTFYDGEGYDGVGGIGCFDPRTREARMIYPERLADWSVSAIEGHGASIYVGLVARHEGSTGGGGIGRYDIATGAFQTLEIPGITGEIAVRGDTIYALTGKGLVVLAPGGEFVRFRVIPGRGRTGRVVTSRGRIE